MDDLGVDRGSLLTIRNACSEAVFEIEDVDTLDLLMTAIDIIDSFLDEEEEVEDEYEDAEFTPSELRF